MAIRVLIIGEGVAGISLSKHMADRGFNVFVVDAVDWPSSTSMATGMINPIVFKRVNASWMAADLLQYATTFYDSLESLLRVRLTEKIALEKVVRSADYKMLWEKRLTETSVKQHIGPIHSDRGPVRGSILVDCPTLVTEYRQYLMRSDALDDKALAYDEITCEKEGYTFRGAFYDMVVFCEGPYAVENPWFQYLPWKLCKGEWMVVEADVDLKDRVLNDVVNIIPMGENRYKISSTFEWERLDWMPSESGKEALSRAFKKVFDVPFKVIEHRAGLRPTVADRRPFIGEHPEQKGMFIFNGLGTKGLLLAPYFGKHLADHLAEGKALDSEVDIARFRKRYKR